MNIYHRRLCRSAGWNAVVRDYIVPDTLAGLDVGKDVLEIGPGFGATTAVLAESCELLTALEYDRRLARRLQRLYPQVTVNQGDGAAMPFEDGRFSAVVCFTMLHHLPNRERQDLLFAEARRVLKPGGVFAGSDTLGGWRTRLIHLADTYVPLDRVQLPGRLRSAGFTDITIPQGHPGLHFAARRGPTPSSA
jgi:SAM-dependent methyltransferase